LACEVPNGHPNAEICGESVLASFPDKRIHYGEVSSKIRARKIGTYDSECEGSKCNNKGECQNSFVTLVQRICPRDKYD
jgi:hypothetical protein